jgi:hypothetical protein
MIKILHSKNCLQSKMQIKMQHIWNLIKCTVICVYVYNSIFFNFQNGNQSIFKRKFSLCLNLVGRGFYWPDIGLKAKIYQWNWKLKLAVSIPLQANRGARPVYYSHRDHVYFDIYAHFWTIDIYIFPAMLCSLRKWCFSWVICSCSDAIRQPLLCKTKWQDDFCLKVFRPQTFRLLINVLPT